MMKVRVCVAYHGKLHEACQPGLEALRQCKEIDFQVETRPTSVIAKGRNSFINDLKSCLLYQKLTLGFDGYLVVDDDIEFTEQDALKLIGNGKSVCHAPYTLHGNDQVYDCGTFHPNFPGHIVQRYNTTSKGLKPVDWAAGGFAYYAAAVFEQIEYPWYRHPIIRVKQSAETASEDVGLCLNLRQHDIPIWCDFDIKIKHCSRD